MLRTKNMPPNGVLSDALWRDVMANINRNTRGCVTNTKFPNPSLSPSSQITEISLRILTSPISQREP